jgi:hypothetical protein
LLEVIRTLREPRFPVGFPSDFIADTSAWVFGVSNLRLAD